MSGNLQYERMVWFEGRVKLGKYPNARHLVEEYEISPRTAQRYIEFMRDRLEAPLIFDRRKHGYYYSDTSFQLPGYWITETNALSLAFAVRLASTIPDMVLKKDLYRLIDRVIGLTGRGGKKRLIAVDDKISVKNIEYARVDDTIFHQVAEALFAEQPLRISYHSPHTTTTSERNIHPLHLMHYMGSWHLVAWCMQKRALRDFAVARIKSIAPAPIAVPLPESLPPMKEYTRRNFGIMQGGSVSQVTLRFAARSVPLVAEQIWHQVQQTMIEPDGSLLLSFPAADFRELVGIVLSHGAAVEVIKPVELQELIKQEILKMMMRYSITDDQIGLSSATEGL